MSQYLYTYAARGIQEFVLRGDKLKEMVGASELIEELSTTVLDHTLKALNLPHKIISQAAGAARILFNSKDDAMRLAALWPMIVHHTAPGLQVVQAIVEADTNIFAAVANAEKQLTVERNLLYPDLPNAGAFTRRCPRTGKPAVAFDDAEPLDIEAHTKRQFSSRKRIAQILDPDATLRWPDDFIQIAGRDNAYLAVIHADGNAFGKMFIRLQQASETLPVPADLYVQLCRSITHITQSAVQQAVKKMCPTPSLFPGRILILAGDDVTAVVRADKAIEFTQELLTAFSNVSREHLARLNKDKSLPLPEQLTATAGIAFVKKSYPFVQAYRLSESLCTFAKNSFKQLDSPPAALAFHRITTSTTSHNFKDIIDDELTANGVCLTMMPYLVVPYGSSSSPLLKNLLSLTEAAQNLPRGKLRTLLTDFYESQPKVERDFQRMITIARKSANNSGNNSNPADMFCRALHALTGAENLITSCKKSPIADIITLAHIQRAEERRATDDDNSDEVQSHDTRTHFL